MAGNIFDQGTRAFDDSYARTGKVYSDIARRRAGAALAGGDRAGAAEALGGEGEVDAVRTLQRDQSADDQQALENQRQAAADQRTEQDRRAGYLKHVSQSAMRIPATDPQSLAKRKAFILESLPIVQQETGADLSKFMQMVTDLPDDHFSDQGLTRFGADLDKLVVFNRGGGGYDVINQGTGEKVRGVEPTLKAPPGFEYDDDGALAPIPGYVAGRKAISDATRAPLRARAPSRGAGGGSSSLPPGY